MKLDDYGGEGLLAWETRGLQSVELVLCRGLRPWQQR